MHVTAKGNLFQTLKVRIEQSNIEQIAVGEFCITLYCDTNFRCKFLTNDACLEWYKRLLQAIQPRQKLQDIFAFAFSAWCMDAWQHQELVEGLNMFAPVSKTGE